MSLAQRTGRRLPTVSQRRIEVFQTTIVTQALAFPKLRWKPQVRLGHRQSRLPGTPQKITLKNSRSTIDREVCRCHYRFTSPRHQSCHEEPLKALSLLLVPKTCRLGDLHLLDDVYLTRKMVVVASASTPFCPVEVFVHAPYYRERMFHNQIYPQRQFLYELRPFVLSSSECLTGQDVVHCQSRNQE